MFIFIALAIFAAPVFAILSTAGWICFRNLFHRLFSRYVLTLLFVSITIYSAGFIGTLIIENAGYGGVDSFAITPAQDIGYLVILLGAALSLITFLAIFVGVIVALLHKIRNTAEQGAAANP